MMIPSGFIFFRRVETTTQIFLITESIPQVERVVDIDRAWAGCMGKTTVVVDAPTKQEVGSLR